MTELDRAGQDVNALDDTLLEMYIEAWWMKRQAWKVLRVSRTATVFTKNGSVQVPHPELTAYKMACSLLDKAIDGLGLSPKSRLRFRGSIKAKRPDQDLGDDPLSNVISMSAG